MWFGGGPEDSHVAWGILEFSGLGHILGRVDLEMEGPYCDKR